MQQIFHHEIDVHALGAHVELADKEIDVAGVWCQADDILVGMGNGDVFRPSHLLVEQPGAEFAEHRLFTYL